MSLINDANLDVSSLGQVAGLFGGGGSGMHALLKAGTIQLNDLTRTSSVSSFVVGDSSRSAGSTMPSTTCSTTPHLWMSTCSLAIPVGGSGPPIEASQ